jgi:hypothetical protein
LTTVVDTDPPLCGGSLWVPFKAAGGSVARTSG